MPRIGPIARKRVRARCPPGPSASDQVPKRPLDDRSPLAEVDLVELLQRRAEHLAWVFGCVCRVCPAGPFSGRNPTPKSKEPKKRKSRNRIRKNHPRPRVLHFVLKWTGSNTTWSLVPCCSCRMSTFTTAFRIASVLHVHQNRSLVASRAM